MNETLLFLIVAALSLVIGAYIGNLIARLKSKSETSKMEERLEQSKLQVDKLQEQFANSMIQRDTIRDEKNFLNVEFAKRNTEFENLEQKLIEQKS